LLKITNNGSVVAAAVGTDYTNFSYLFPNDATTTRITFTSGLLALGSTTLGNGTQAGGLTISGGATTTGFLTVQGSGTSTFANGIRLTGGCFQMADGTCAGASGGAGT